MEKPPISVSADEQFHTPYPDPLWIAQFEVEHALRQRLGELCGHVEFGAEATGLDQDDEGVTVTLRTASGEQTVRSRFAVGADGGKSGTRKLIGLPLAGETYEEQRWYLGDVTLGSELDRDHMHIWPADRGMLRSATSCGSSRAPSCPMRRRARPRWSSTSGCSTNAPDRAASC